MMNKIRKVIYLLVIVMLFSISTVSASEAKVVQDDVKTLTLEEAVGRAKQRNKQLKLQQKNIDFAKKDLEEAYDDYKNTSEYAYEHANLNYSVKRAEKDYAQKAESLWEEKVTYDVEMQFDAIIDAEEKYDLAQKQLKMQEEKNRNTARKEQLGLASKADIKVNKVSLDTHRQEIKNLDQTITAEYRKLADKIGNKVQRYHLVKENIYTPVDQKRSLEAYISYAVDMNPSIWLQGEKAKLQEGIIGVNAMDGSGAPTYTAYEKSKIQYEQALMGVSAVKETAELGLKDLYQAILELEIQYEKALISLEEIKRQSSILEKQYELGFIPLLTLEEARLDIIQNRTQINSLIRQHNKLKIQFEKSYIMQL